MNKTILAGAAALGLALSAGLADAAVIDFASLPDGLAANPLVQTGATFTTLDGGFNVIASNGLCPSVASDNAADCHLDLQVDFATASAPISFTFLDNNDHGVGDDIGDVTFFSGATMLGSVDVRVADADPFTKDLVTLGGFSGVTRMVIVTTDFGGVVYDDFAFTPGPGVAEPAAWALMIGGFGMAGAMLRRRRSGPQPQSTSLATAP